MNKLFKNTALLLSVLVLVTGCFRMKPVNNISDHPIPNIETTKLSSEKIGKIIAATASDRHWLIESSKPGKIICTIKWGNYSATSQINYTTKSYSIELVSSENLSDEEGKIHKKYNHYVNVLKNSIDKRLSLGQ